MRQPAGLPHEGVAVQQHERRLAEALDQRLQVARVGAPQVQVGVAEPAVHLDGERIAGRLVRLERGDDVLGHAVEPAAVGRDRLQRGEAVLAGPLRRGGGALATGLEPQNRQGGAAGEVAELLPARAGARRRVAVVEEQELGVGGADEGRRVPARVGRESPRIDGLLVRLAAQVLGELRDRAPVRGAGRDVRPLARVGALGEEPAELVEARRVRAQDPVRVLVDEADAL